MNREFYNQKLGLLFADSLGLAVEHLGEETSQAGAFANGKVASLELFDQALNVRFLFGSLRTAAKTTRKDDEKQIQ